MFGHLLVMANDGKRMVLRGVLEHRGNPVFYVVNDCRLCAGPSPNRYMRVESFEEMEDT